MQDENNSLKLRETPEQKEFQEKFRRTGGAITSTPCPCCCPRLVGTGKKVRGWIRGEVGEGTCAVECNNCGFIRVSKARSKSGVEQPTPAQQRTLDRIKTFFTERASNRVEGEPLKEFKVESDTRGGWWVVVRTSGNMWIASGAHIHVGGHGSIKVWSVYDLVNKELSEQLQAHYEFMLSPR